jgi:hypothetical protein
MFENQSGGLIGTLPNMIVTGRPLMNPRRGCWCWFWFWCCGIRSLSRPSNRTLLFARNVLICCIDKRNLVAQIFLISNDGNGFA